MRQEQLDHALIEAIRQNDLSAVRLCLDEGANANAYDTSNRGYSLWQRLKDFTSGQDAKRPVNRLCALHLALIPSVNGPQSHAIIQALLEHGADVNAKAFEGKTPLMLMEATLNQDPVTIDLLLEKGADINARDNSGDTLLTLATFNGDIRTVRLLLKKGVNVNVHTNDGVTLLMNAVLSDDPQMLSLFLDKGLDINAQDKYGQTALMYAVSQHHGVLLVKALLNHHADVHRKANDGTTAWTLATGHQIELEKGQQDEIVALLKASGAEQPGFE